MAKILSAHLCDYAFHTKELMPSLIGIRRAFFPQSLPIGIPHLYFFAEIEVTPTEAFDINTQITSPSGKIVGDPWKATPVIPPGYPSKSIDVANAMTRLSFEEEGEYTLEISINGTMVHTLTFLVEVVR